MPSSQRKRDNKRKSLNLSDDGMTPISNICRNDICRNELILASKGGRPSKIKRKKKRQSIYSTKNTNIGLLFNLISSLYYYFKNFLLLSTLIPSGRFFQDYLQSIRWNRRAQ